MEQNLTRREARENAFLAAFSATFHPDDPQPVLLNQPESHEHPLDEFSLRILRDMEAHSEEIDDVIRANLKGWTIARVPRVSLVALRVALAEMMYGEEKKTSVAINEAVELVKKYGSDKDYQFVNGLLGTVASCPCGRVNWACARAMRCSTIPPPCRKCWQNWAKR